MKVIGVTGGVGSGKSEILHYLNTHYPCRIVMADEVGHEVMRRGQPAYEPLVNLLGSVPGGPLLDPDGEIDRKEMAARIFSEESLRQQVNALIHPAVRVYIEDEIAREREKEASGAADTPDYFILEAALLIECGYRDVVDEMWYIYCDPKVRAERLLRSRGYSDEKTAAICAGQLSEEAFRAGSDVVIDNSGDLADAFRQADEALQR